MVDDIGKEHTRDFSEELAYLRKSLSDLLHLDKDYPGQGIWGEALSKLVEMSGDPDSHAASWPTLGTPLGICEEIPIGNVFPFISENDIAEQQRVSAIAQLAGADGNYRSYEENKSEADELFKTERDKGFAEWSVNRHHLEQQVGTLVMSSIRVVVKYKGEPPTQKLRLVHDLRRSNVNENIVLRERLVHKEPGEEVYLLRLDFSDAFKQLPVRESEKRFLSGRAMDGHFYFHRVLFGIKTGPLVWCRLAALRARCTQSCFHPGRLRMQVFVDDPLAVLRGTPQQVRDIASKVLLLWQALGLTLAWKKGSFSTRAHWIGAWPRYVRNIWRNRQENT